MKKCASCKTEKPYDEYHRDKKRNDGYNSRCKECKKITEKVSAKKYKNKRRANDHIRSHVNSVLIYEYKQNSTGCRCCGETDPIVLEFHHKNPSKKEIVLSQCRNYPRDRVIKEIEKCMIVCSNCHRKIHHGNLTLTLDGKSVFEY